MKQLIAILITMLFFSMLSFAQTLDNYFKIAAENNAGLQAVYKEYEAALQKVPQVTALPDPTFSFGYFVTPVETRVGPQQAKFSLAQMFPWFGTLKSQGNAATLLAEAKFQNFLDARNKLFFKVASAYYTLYELRDWTRIEQENIRILQSYKAIATQNFKNEKGTMVDVLRVDIMLKDAQTNLEILKVKEKPLLTTFNSLLNRPENEIVQIRDSLKAEILSENFNKDSLIATNPTLRALELKHQASKASELVAQKQGLPKLGVGLDYVIVGKRSDVSLPENGKNAFMPMVNVSIPIFRARHNASVREAQLMQESYTHQKQEVANALQSEYEMTWFQVQQQLQLLSLYDQQTQTSQQSLNLLLSSYANSGKEFIEVLRMQQQLLKYRKMSATAMVQYHTAVQKINYLTSKSYEYEKNR